MGTIISKRKIKNQIKKTYIEYMWNLYKLTIKDIFDNNGEEFFKFIDSINLRDEISKIATNEYMNALKEYSKVKEDFEL